MEAIIYLLKRNVINSLKELKKKPLRLIFYIAIVGLMVMSLRFSIKANIQVANTNIDIYRSIFLSIILMLLFVSLKAGIEKGNTLFRLSDVNFLFTAPISSQLVLIYGFIKQMGSNFILILLLGFQMPNLYSNFSMKSYGWIIVLLATFLYALLSSVMAIFVYSIGSIKEKYKRIISYSLYGLMALVVLGLLYNVVKVGEPLKAAISFLNMDFFNYIPIIGWLLNIYTSAISGFTPTTLIYIVLILMSGIGFLFIIYNLDLDYYEDALNASLTKEEQLARAKSGSTNWSQSKTKTRKTIGKIDFTRAKSIFSKQVLESKKIGLVFIDKSTFFVAGFSLIFAFFARENGINFLLYMMVYINVIFSQSNLWTRELEKHYIYLIPESSIKKIIYATALENIKGLVTGIITFTIATFIYDLSILEGILLGLVYGSFTSVILFSDLVIRRILGVGLSLFVERLLRLLILILILIPGIFLSLVLGTAIGKYTGGQGVYLTLIIYNILISLLFIGFSRGIFEKVDMR